MLTILYREELKEYDFGPGHPFRGDRYEIFPRFLKDQNPHPRGSDTMAWAVLVCLNVGLLLRFAFEPFYLMGPKPSLAALMALSGILQAVAVLGFGLLIWGRIRAMEP